MSIFVWGTGCGASELIQRGLSPEQITAFVDSRPMGPFFQGKPVLLPEQLRGKNIDLLIVTTRQTESVAAQIEALALPADRVLYLKNNCTCLDRNAACKTALPILGKPLLDALLPSQHLIPTPSSLQNARLDTDNDYVRTATLELLCRRIANVPGAAAELGVYRGGFARCINFLLPGKTLYLFDTFQGFAPEEGARERQSGTCGAAFLEAHRNTQAEEVLRSMPHPQSVELKVGLFPQSLEGLETNFCLVSLDADFRESTLAGLRYFWPRLSPGGYLLLHDWGCPRLTGVAQALEAYQQELGEKLPGVPLPDVGNTLVLCKM